MDLWRSSRSGFPVQETCGMKVDIPAEERFGCLPPTHHDPLSVSLNGWALLSGQEYEVDINAD